MNRHSLNNQIKRLDRLNALVNATKRSSFKLVFKTFIICFLFLGIIYYFAETQKPGNIHLVNHVVKKTGIRSRLLTLAGDRNILFLGVDSNGRIAHPFFGTRSDTIILINIAKNGDSVNMISIPRDSKVYISGKKRADKINSAHAYGGPALTVKTIEETFGIDINNYIVVNYQGVRDFIDAIGGVPVDVEKRMYYRDRTAGLLIDIEPGFQVLGAKKAEGYLRFRHDARGDIGRIKRQQWFLQALLNKLKSGGIIFKAPELLEIMGKNVKTDLNLFDMSKFLNIARKLKPENIQIATLPGHPSKYGVVSYWILDADKTQKIIKRLIYRDNPSENEEELTISLFYHPELAGDIDDITDKIHDLGFKVKFRAKEKNHYSQIISHTKKAAFSRTGKLTEEIPGLSNCQYIVKPDTAQSSYTDFTIILAD